MKAVQRHQRKASFSKTNKSIPEVPVVDKNAPLKIQEVLSTFAENRGRKLADKREEISASADFAPPSKVEKIPRELTRGASSTQDSKIPEVDVNATLNIEKLKTSAVPLVDKNAPLKFEEDTAREEKIVPNKKTFIVGGIILGLTTLLTIWAITFYIKIPKEKDEEIGNVVEEEIKTGEDDMVLVRKDWKLEILNGSKTVGVAKETAEKLEGLGYTVIKMGNAANSDYKLSEVYVSNDLFPKSDLFINDIKKELGIEATLSGELKEGTSSAKLIIGNE